MSPANEITLIMIAVSVACAIPGCFLVLRKMAMIADAIGHTMIFGIVAAYAIVADLDSVWLIVAAAGTGVLTVWLVEWLQRSGVIKQDAAIGLVFPFLFALGTLLASLKFRQIHLDVDAVLLGQIETARLSRLQLPGLNLGFDLPRPAVVMLTLSIINALFAAVFYKELKLSTFDRILAIFAGFLPTLLHFALVTFVSLTAVAAFDIVGPVLVVAFFVIPAATAKLICRKLSTMIFTAIAIGVVGAIVGCQLAFYFDSNTAGTVTTTLAMIFAAAVLYTKLKSPH